MEIREQQEGEQEEKQRKLIKKKLKNENRRREEEENHKRSRRKKGEIKDPKQTTKLEIHDADHTFKRPKWVQITNSNILFLRNLYFSAVFWGMQIIHLNLPKKQIMNLNLPKRHFVQKQASFCKRSVNKK